MKYNIKHLITFIILITTLTSCFKYEDVEMIGVKDMGVKGITAKGVTFQVDMQIKNPNNYNISIVGSDLDLFIKDKKTGRVNLSNKVTLPKKSNKVHQFVFETDYKEITKDPLSVLSTVLGDSRMIVQVKGSIKARAKGVSKKFPVDFKEKISL